MCQLLQREGTFLSNLPSYLISRANTKCEQNFGPEVKEKASIFVPSIGKVTIVVLLRNLLVSDPLYLRRRDFSY